MSCRVDSTLIAGACVVGDRGLGVLGSVIRATTGPSSGLHGAGYLYNDWQAGDDGKEFRGLIVTPPSAGTFTAYEDGSFGLAGAPDGAYSFVYRLYVDGVDLGTATASITVGTPVPALTAAVAGLASFTVTATGAVQATVFDPEQFVPTVAWSQWSPYILPYVAGCPDTTMEFHVRQAAIEFCQRTLAWQSDLAPIASVADVDKYLMPLPADAALVKVLTFAVDGVTASVVTVNQGEALAEAKSSANVSWTGDRVYTTVSPVPSGDATRYGFKVALRPTQTATTVAAVLFEHYATEIAAGALASILSIEGAPWARPTTSLVRRQSFEDSMDKVSRQVSKGFSRGAQRVRALWF